MSGAVVVVNDDTIVAGFPTFPSRGEGNILKITKNGKYVNAPKSTDFEAWRTKLKHPPNGETLARAPYLGSSVIKGILIVN